MSNPISGRRVAFPDAYPDHEYVVVNGEAGIYQHASGRGEPIQINHDATPWHYVDTEEAAGEHLLTSVHTRDECPAEDQEEPDEIEEIVGHIRRKDGTVAAFRIAQFPSDTGYGYVQWGTPALGRNVSLLETITSQLNGDFE